MKEAVAAAIRSARAERGWTVRELADKAGLSFQYVNAIENATPESNPTVEALGRLLAALDLEPYFLPQSTRDALVQLADMEAPTRSRAMEVIRLLPGAPADLVDGFLAALAALQRPGRGGTTGRG